MPVYINGYLCVAALGLIIGYSLGKRAGYRAGLKASQFETLLRAVSDTTRILLGKHRCTDCCSSPCAHISKTEIERLISLIEQKDR